MNRLRAEQFEAVEIRTTLENVVDVRQQARIGMAAFDGDPQVVGQQIAGLTVLPMDRLDQEVREQEITIGIVAVPVDRTQDVIDRLMDCGVRAILNYAPIAPQVQPGVRIRNIDPVLSLQSMTFYLRDGWNGLES